MPAAAPDAPLAESAIHHTLHPGNRGRRRAWVRRPELELRLDVPTRVRGWGTLKPARRITGYAVIVGALAAGTIAAFWTDGRAQDERPAHEEPAADTPAPAIAGPRVARDTLATAVVNREPVRISSPIPADVGLLYYFTEVVESEPSTTILHLWYWRNRNVSVVLLKTSGPRFRTWSQKSIPPAWTGDWRVEARTPDGTILSSTTFRVERAGLTDDEGTDPRR